MGRKNGHRTFFWEGCLPACNVYKNPHKEKFPQCHSNASFLIMFQTLMIWGQPCRYYQDCEAARRHLSRQESLALDRCRLVLSLADDGTRSSTCDQVLDSWS